MAAALAIAAFTIAAPGCSRPTDAQQRDLAWVVPPPSEPVFRYAAIGSEFLDPAKIGESAGHQLMLNVFEGLYSYAQGDGQPVESMARGCTATTDGLVHTCTLRDDIVWSDGVAITADDFVWSWRRALQPATASRAAHLLWFIAGAKAYNDGTVSDPAKVGVKALNLTTLQITLAAPTPFFRHLLAEMPYVPTPRHVIEKHGAQWTRPEHIVSNGPYLLAEHHRRSKVVLRKNPRYFGAKDVHIERVEAFLTESEQTAFDWYETGKVDWTGDPTLPGGKLAVVARAKRADLHRDPYLCTYYYAFRTDKPPFTDPRVRRAFDLAIDRERLLAHVLNNGATAAAGNVPVLFAKTHGYSSRKARTFDPEAARRLLADAGFAGGKGLEAVELTFNTQDVHRTVAEFVQRSLLENLGVRVVLANMEWKTLLKRMRSGDFDLSRSGWCADYPDPLTFLEVFQSGNSANYSGFSNAGYDRLLDMIRGQTDAEMRNHMIFEAEELLARERPMLPLFHYARAYMLRPWVQGFSPQMQDFHPFKYLRLQTAEQWRRDVALRSTTKRQPQRGTAAP